MAVGSAHARTACLGVRSEGGGATALSGGLAGKEEPVVLWASWLVERSAEAGAGQKPHYFRRREGKRPRGQAKGGVWTRAVGETGPRAER